MNAGEGILDISRRHRDSLMVQGLPAAHIRMITYFFS